MQRCTFTRPERNTSRLSNTECCCMMAFVIKFCALETTQTVKVWLNWRIIAHQIRSHQKPTRHLPPTQILSANARNRRTIWIIPSAGSRTRLKSCAIAQIYRAVEAKSQSGLTSRIACKDSDTPLHQHLQLQAFTPPLFLSPSSDSGMGRVCEGLDSVADHQKSGWPTFLTVEPVSEVVQSFEELAAHQ